MMKIDEDVCTPWDWTVGYESAFEIEYYQSITASPMTSIFKILLR
jgi:hypothetical protein